MCFPFFYSLKIFSDKNSLTNFIFSFIMIIVSAIWVNITPSFKDSNNEYPFSYYIICLLINAVHSIFIYTIFVAPSAFFAKVSDKKIGGTYMTFLNTLSTLGKYSLILNKIDIKSTPFVTYRCELAYHISILLC